MAEQFGEALKSPKVLPGQTIPGAIPPNGTHSINFREDGHKTEVPTDRGQGTNDTFA